MNFQPNLETAEAKLDLDVVVDATTNFIKKYFKDTAPVYADEEGAKIQVGASAKGVGAGASVSSNKEGFKLEVTVGAGVDHKQEGIWGKALDYVQGKLSGTILSSEYKADTGIITNNVLGKETKKGTR